MKITLYVATDTYNLYREEDFNEILKDKAKSLAKDEDELVDYLDYTYTSLELFRLTDEEQKDVMLDFEEDWCLKRAKQILLEDAEYVEREVEI